MNIAPPAGATDGLEAHPARPPQRAVTRAGALRHVADSLRGVEADVVRCERCPRLRDWCRTVAKVKVRRFQDQRYWGRPIPIVYCDMHGEQPVPEDQLPVQLPTDVDFRPTGESPLTRSESFHQAKCPKCGALARRGYAVVHALAARAAH